MPNWLTHLSAQPYAVSHECSFLLHRRPIGLSSTDHLHRDILGSIPRYTTRVVTSTGEVTIMLPLYTTAV